MILFIAAGLTAFATLFTILGVALPGWNVGQSSLFNCGIVRCSDNSIAAGALLIIAIVFLVIAIALTIMFARRSTGDTPHIIKGILLALLIIAAIFIVIAYSRVIPPYNSYSYHLTATASILTFCAALIVAYWFGRDY
jgi:hypothetical protein